MTKRNEEQRQARVEELKKFNRVPNTLQSRMTALFGKVEGEKKSQGLQKWHLLENLKKAVLQLWGNKNGNKYWKNEKRNWKKCFCT